MSDRAILGLGLCAAVSTAVVVALLPTPVLLVWALGTAAGVGAMWLCVRT